MKLPVFVFAAVLLAGCAAYERSDEAATARTRMVGMSAEAVRACAGPPRRRESRGDDEIWIYATGEDQPRRGPDDSAIGNSGVPGLHRESPIPLRYCVVRITLRDHKVSNVTYSGTTGGVFSRGEQCAFLVGNCAR